MFLLKITTPDGRYFNHAFKGDQIVIGRSPNADITLEDTFLSRKHVRLYRSGTTLVIEDLHSANGTWLNGKKILSPVPAVNGDIVQISESTLVFEEIDSKRIDVHESDSVIVGAQTLLNKVQASHLGPGAPEAPSQSAKYLKILNEVHETLSRPLPIEELLNFVLEQVFTHLQPDQALVFLKREDGKLYEAARRSQPDFEHQCFASVHLSKLVVEQKRAVLTPDLSTEKFLAEAQSLQGLTSLLAAPLLDVTSSIGMIVLTSGSPGRRFVEDDLKLLVSLGTTLALRIRNLALVQESTRRRQELLLAGQIQSALLSGRIPEFAAYEVYAESTPSQSVSGDFFRVAERGVAGECILLLVDVSGKGITAALLTASIEALSTPLIEGGLGPAEIFTKLSNLLYQRTPPEKYATAILAVLNSHTGEIEYANAGHPPGFLVRRTGKVDRLAATGRPLGILPEQNYASEPVALEEGDSLILYSDGFTEAENIANVEYGVTKLMEICVQHRAKTADQLASLIEADLLRFTDREPIRDDRTLIITRRAEPAIPN